ncbi:SDR family NAD(P)-dependent oxidoreductase [Desulfosporosinus nitroreducens]|uniref:SDR family NAD(P)-dependent oxidoreductase n=1 Tax=Desulfosporosinus nitroreducens TaxID=2018668 RepID=A0ABT8QJY2_9FIRM|nr:SDR family NAD(P)-dependent oxidoreductase [Desulfosporosinus nitroreducens]MCO1600352.1 SDR family NAD(P)-dependent oxidoreductase [Desulfosporosinus nitroreducens]MDO0821440.1 SDR family NAD(P)-dependent oxidoreductase [Desulfosporosinus nitroreducens]
MNIVIRQEGVVMHNYSLREFLLFPPVYLNVKKLRSELQGKTVLITGASFGIGEKLAYLLADMNIHLILVARTEEKLLTMKREIEEKAAKVSVYSADLRKPEEIKELLTFIHQLPDGLDLLVSNAGISIRRSISHSLDRYHDFTRTMAINYFAPVQLLLSLIPLLEKNKGQVINISTINVLLIPFPYWAAYQASKTAFDTWFRSVEPELNAMDISTTTIYLPLVKTRMIMPTTAYQKLPAMNPYHVGKIICKSMYTKRQKYRPWWFIFGQFASLMFRGIWELSTSVINKKEEI